MSEDKENVERTDDLPDEDESKASARRKRVFYWQIYGWSVIGLMILLILLNLFGLFDPNFNRYGMIAMVLAYAVYIIFRRR